MRMAAILTSTLLTHHVAPKLESILDREAKISHETFAAQIEARLGYGEGDNAKGPDMKVWNKDQRLSNVSFKPRLYLHRDLNTLSRLTGHQRSSVIPLSSSHSQRRQGMTCDRARNHQQMIWHTRVYFWSRLGCDTRVTVRI